MNTHEQVEIHTPEPAGKPGRRRVLDWIWKGIGLAALAEFCWIGASFLISRKDRDTPAATARVVTAGSVDQFAPGSVTAIPSGRFYLSRLEDGGFLALSRTCTHLGCSLNWDEKKKRFICPCHGSSFGLAGEVLTAPASRPLPNYPVRIENGVVKVDVSAPRARDRFEAGQATSI